MTPPHTDSHWLYTALSPSGTFPIFVSRTFKDDTWCEQWSFNDCRGKAKDAACKMCDEKTNQWCDGQDMGECTNMAEQMAAMGTSTAAGVATTTASSERYCNKKMCPPGKSIMCPDESCVKAATDCPRIEAFDGCKGKKSGDTCEMCDKTDPGCMSMPSTMTGGKQVCEDMPMYDASGTMFKKLNCHMKPWNGCDGKKAGDACKMCQAGDKWCREDAGAGGMTTECAKPYVEQNKLYNIQCSEIFTLRNEKLHTEA